jgi:hypothetical protein
MIITDNNILTQLWAWASAPQNQTKGKTDSQRSAFKLLLDVPGGVEFVVYRPAEEIEELGRRGVCSANLPMLLRKMAGVEAKKRQAREHLADLELQLHRLLCEAAEPDATTIVPITQRERRR